MKTSVIAQEPAIILIGNSYNGGEDCEISWQELRDAKIGESWSSDNYNCARAMHVETLKIVYKDDDGIACTKRTEKSTDSPNAQRSEVTELVWFNFN